MQRLDVESMSAECLVAVVEVEGSVVDGGVLK